MASAAQIRANEKYDKAHTTGVYLKLNNETDKDILEYLASVPNRQGYIKQLIRKDMEQSAPDCTIVPVSVPDKYMDDLRKEAKENHMTVPELLWSAAKGDMPWLKNK